MLICLQNTTPLLALYCHPNDPVTSTVLLPTQDNNRANIYTIHRPTNRANTPAITTRPNDRADAPAIYRPNDRAYTPTINRPTDRQALYLTTIITVAGTILPPGQTAAMLAADFNLTITALPAAYRLLLLCLQPN